MCVCVDYGRSVWGWGGGCDYGRDVYGLLLDGRGMCACGDLGGVGGGEGVWYGWWDWLRNFVQ